MKMKAAPCLVILGVLAMLASPAPAPPRAQQQQGSADDEGLPPDLLQGLEQRSDSYRRAVRRFTNREELLEENLEPKTGSLNSRHESGYRYLLQSDPDNLQVTEYREIQTRAGVPVRSSPAVLQTLMPPPYLWATLFDERNSGSFRFRLLGSERRGVTDTLVIEFEGQMGFDQGTQLSEWSGRIWMDRDRLIPLHLEAEPARQEEVLGAQLEEYRKAFKLGGVRLKARPKAYVLSVEFLVSRYGLNFPSQTTWRRQVVDGSGLRTTERFVRRRYVDYRFLNIRTDEILGDLADEEPES
jgi:hypothetical protein